MWIPIELFYLIIATAFMVLISHVFGDDFLMWLVVGAVVIAVVILPFGLFAIARPEAAATVVFLGGSAGIVFLVWRAVRADRAWAAKRLKLLLTSHPPGVKDESSSAAEETPVRVAEAADISEDGKTRWIG